MPKEVFDLLETATGLCPNFDAVILEQLGTALVTEAQQTRFRDDFVRMREIVQQASSASLSRALWRLPGLQIQLGQQNPSSEHHGKGEEKLLLPPGYRIRGRFLHPRVNVVCVETALSRDPVQAGLCFPVSPSDGSSAY